MVHTDLPKISITGFPVESIFDAATISSDNDLAVPNISTLPGRVEITFGLIRPREGILFFIDHCADNRDLKLEIHPIDPDYVKPYWPNIFAGIVVAFLLFSLPMALVAVVFHVFGRHIGTVGIVLWLLFAVGVCAVLLRKFPVSDTWRVYERLNPYPAAVTQGW